MTAPQLELFASTLVAPAPARECGKHVPEDDRGYAPPPHQASIESANLHDGFTGRLIWCRPDSEPSLPRTVRWRRIVSTDTHHQDWTDRSVIAADPDGTTHRCGLAQKCAIAVTPGELARAHHWRIQDGKTLYEGHDLEPTDYMVGNYIT